MGISKKKIHHLLDFCAIDVITKFAVKTNVVIKRVNCIYVAYPLHILLKQ